MGDGSGVNRHANRVIAPNLGRLWQARLFLSPGVHACGIGRPPIFLPFLLQSPSGDGASASG